jgi:hypothetical protein
MDHGSGIPPLGGRSPADDYQWHMFSESPGNCIQDAQSTYPVSHDSSACPVQTGIAVGCIPSVQFVAGTYPINGAGNDLIEKIQDIIARNPENVPDPDLLEAGKDVSGNCKIFAHTHVYIINSSSGKYMEDVFQKKREYFLSCNSDKLNLKSFLKRSM